MVEHELRNRWKRSYLGKLELNRTPLSLQHSSVGPKHARGRIVAPRCRLPLTSTTWPGFACPLAKTLNELRGHGTKFAIGNQAFKDCIVGQILFGKNLAMLRRILGDPALAQP